MYIPNNILDSEVEEMLLLFKSSNHDYKVTMSDSLGRVQLVALYLSDWMKNESSSKILVE